MSPAGSPLSALPNKGLGCSFLSAEGQPPHSLEREREKECRMRELGKESYADRQMLIITLLDVD